MKNKLLLVCSLIFLFASCQSKEDKANKLIKNDLFKTLHDFASYEPVETIVDSAFKSVYYDSASLLYGEYLKELVDQVNEHLDEAKEAKSYMDIYKEFSLAQKEYNNAKIEYKSRVESAGLLLKKVDTVMSYIQETDKKFNNEFYGWKVTHKFRCKTKGGNSILADYLYIFDPDFKTILYKENMDDEDVQSMRKYIKEALENEKEK